jgi:hypothetical protein
MGTCVRYGIPRLRTGEGRKLRIEKKLSVVEIAERLALPKTTIWDWVRDLPLDRPRRANAGQRRGNLAVQQKYRRLREAAYARGRSEFPELTADPTFRDFACMYIARATSATGTVSH